MDIGGAGTHGVCAGFKADPPCQIVSKPRVSGFKTLADETLVAEGRGVVWRLVQETWEPLHDLASTCLAPLRLSEPLGARRFLACSYYPMTAGLDLSGSDGPVTVAGPPWERAAAGIWVTSEDEMYAAGLAGELSYFEGGDYALEESWKPVEFASDADRPGRYTEVGGGELVGVGPGGLIVRFAGGVPSVEVSGTTADLWAAWGTPEDGTYVVGAGGTLLHHDGLTWREIPTGVSVDLHAVHGRTEGAVAVAGADGFVAVVDR